MSNYETAAAVAQKPHSVSSRQEQGRHSDSETPLSQTAAGNTKAAGSGLEKLQNFRVEFGPSSKDIVNFTNQLAVMVRAGISLQESLESIASQQNLTASQQ